MLVFSGLCFSTSLIVCKLIHSCHFVSFMLNSKYLLPISSCLASSKLAHLTINWTSPIGCPIKILTSHTSNLTSSFLITGLCLCFLAQLEPSSPEILIISLIPILPFRHLINLMSFFILFPPCPYTMIIVLAQILIIAYLDRCNGFSLPISLVFLAILCTAPKPIY